MKRRALILFGACFAFTPAGLRAQTPGTIQQVDTARQRQQIEQTAKSQNEDQTAPELYPGESGDVGPQSVLKIKPRKTLFEATADVQYFYTDNMFLTEHDKQAADVLVSTAVFALAPTPYELGDGTFAPRLGYQHQWFDFGLADSDQVTVHNFNTGSGGKVGLNTFDFNAQKLFTDGRWTCGNWIVEAGFDFTRLMSTSGYDEFYKEYVPRWGVQRNFALNEKGALSVGYAGDYRFTDAHTLFPFFSQDFDARTDQSLFATYTQALCRHAVLQPYYQFKYTHFTHSTVGTRNDCLNSFGLALYCIVCPRFEIRGFFDYNIRNSDNNAVAEYRQLDAGGGVNVMFKF